MPKLDITELENELQKGKICPLYIIVGAEHHLALSALKMIQTQIKAQGSDESSVMTVSAREARVETVIGMLRTVPLLGGRPVVVIRDGEFISKSMLEALAIYVASPVEASTLIIVAEKLDGRTRFMQEASKRAIVIECKPLYDDKIPLWINMEARRKGRQFSQDAARYLAQMVGKDMGQLSQAIERIILYVGDNKLVELKSVEEAIAETHQHTIFEFTDAVGTRRWPKAFALLKNILENGESPILVVNMLARHFRLLSKAKEIFGRISDSEVARYLGVHPYYVKNYISQAKNFSSGELKRGFHLLHRCDRELKSSRLAKERILERALLGLME